MNKLNRLYDQWALNPSSAHLGQLLEGVRRHTVYRFARIVVSDNGQRGPLDSNFEDIASATMMEVWRALPGYPGNDKLKEYKHFGKFAQYVATVARGTRAKMIDLHDNSMVTRCDPQDLQYMVPECDARYEPAEPEEYYADPED